MKALRNSLFVLALSPLVACGGSLAQSDDGQTAADSADTADVTTALSSLTSDGSDMAAATGDAAAAGAKAGVMAKLNPSGCVTANAVANVVSYTFNNCTGPYGLVKLTGTVTATYTKANAGASLAVALTSTNLAVNGAQVSLNSTSVISGPPTARTATVTTMSSATTANGKSISHSGAYTAKWDGMCVSLDGAFSTKVGLASWNTVVTGYKRCSGVCPESGKVVINGAGGTATISYTGSAVALVLTSGGDSGTITLACGK